MKRCIFATLACSLSLTAQQSNVSSSTQVDINGNRISDGPVISQTKSATGSVTTETRQSINGRSVPVEQVEQRVLRDDASGKVTEQLFDETIVPLKMVGEGLAGA